MRGGTRRRCDVLRSKRSGPSPRPPPARSLRSGVLGVGGARGAHQARRGSAALDGVLCGLSEGFEGIDRGETGLGGLDAQSSLREAGDGREAGLEVGGAAEVEEVGDGEAEGGGEVGDGEG